MIITSIFSPISNGSLFKVSMPFFHCVFAEVCFRFIAPFGVSNLKSPPTFRKGPLRKLQANRRAALSRVWLSGLFSIFYLNIMKFKILLDRGC
uniref:Uncharacterized protein n=1 Tax=Candidatus Kentrum sp. MB TaxID=2138164 RepID=A0A450X6F5_9GAMM|nr:MAG: hypothetical protein BECKMB1821G_GA0114241_101013 [Candidatus Kentron sp. MB]